MNASDKQIKMNVDKFVSKDAGLDKAALESFENSKKVYVEGSTPDIQVPFREISISDTPSEFGAEKNAPVLTYDTSGPYTDPKSKIDIKNGLIPLRNKWIEDRKDTEQLQGPSSTFGKKRKTDPSLEDMRFNLKRNPKKAVAGKNVSQSFAEAVDMVTGQRSMLFSDIGDMFGMSSKVEGMMGKAANFNFMYINMMSRWTEFMKSAASVTIGSRILEDSIKWSKGTLSDKFKTKLAASGIDEEIAKRIAKMHESHGTKTTHNFMANTVEWTDDLAKQRFGAALNKDINITIVTPGKGDTPLFMNYELASTIVQFKKFAMASTQRMLMRGMQEKDMDFLFGSMLLMGSGMLVDSVYTTFRFDKDYSKKSLTAKLLAAFDRSGLGGIFVDVNRSIEALTDNRIGIAPLMGEGKPYGSSMKSKVGLLGPSASQIYNIFDIMYDVGGKSYNHYTARNVRRLIPFQNVWYLDWLFDDLEKGLRFK